jgi:lipoate-protein ligase A
MTYRLARGVEKQFNVELEAGRLSADEERYSRMLFAQKYSSDEWNLRGNRRLGDGTESVG